MFTATQGVGGNGDGGGERPRRGDAPESGAGVHGTGTKERGKERRWLLPACLPLRPHGGDDAIHFMLFAPGRAASAHAKGVTRSRFTC